MKLRASALLLSLLFSTPLHAAPVEIARESFEAGGIGFTTSVPQFDEPTLATSDFFSVQPNNGTKLSAGTLAGGDGANMFAAEDIDTAPALLAPQQSITFTSVNIAGKTTVTARLLLAAPGSGASQSFYDHDAGGVATDFLRVEASVDGGPFTRLAQYSPTTATLNQTLSLDNDANGVGGDGPAFGAGFQEFIYPVSNGNTLQIRVVMQSNATNEYLCVDNVRVFADTPTTSPPSLGGVPGTALTYTEGSPATPVAPDITVTDTDSANMTSATVSISSGYVNGEDLLSATPSGSIVAGDIVFAPATGVLTITRSATKANYETVLRSVGYRNTNGSNPVTGTRNVQFRVNDGTNVSNQPIRAVDVVDNITLHSLPFTESFETDGRGTRYALDGRFTNGTATFDRIAAAGLTNVDGSFVIEGEDTVLNPVAVEAVRFSLNAVGTSNMAVSATVRLGAKGGSVFDAGDEILIATSLDGGAWQTIGAFRSTGFNSPMALDADGNGVGEGTQLSTALQDFTFPLPAAATNWGFRVQLVSNSGGERLVVDRISVSGIPYDYHVANTADSGPGSLRSALHDAALHAGADTITFAAGLAGQTITLSSEIPVSGPVTMNASGLTPGLTISGGAGTNRIFLINTGAVAAFTALTLTGGDGGGSGAPANYGGAIHTAGTLTLTECSISACSAFAGGAIFNVGGTQTLTLNRCTLSGNTASHGGAIQNEAVLIATQSTLSGNSASVEGGAISSPFGKPATLIHCSISSNTATGLGGGGIGSAFTLTNSIVAGNTDTTAGTASDNLSGTPTLTGANLTSGDPLLAPLGNYGGPTRTMALLPSSPARNAAVSSTATADQRGFPVVGTPDIGAYEAGATTSNYNAWIYESLPAANSFPWNATVPDAQHASTFDYDGDGQSNGAEFDFLTDPGSGGGSFSPTTAPSGTNLLLISFPSATGRTYTLLQSDTLPGSFVSAGLSPIAGDGGVKSFTVPTSSLTRRFYQVQAGP